MECNGSSIFGIYHSGVEWGWWQGPTDCTGTLNAAPSLNDFLKQLETVKVVRCDAVAIRILGLSLAGWNAVISAAMALAAAEGGSVDEWRTRLRVILEGQEVPSLDLLTRIDALLTTKSKTPPEKNLQEFLF